MRLLRTKLLPAVAVAAFCLLSGAADTDVAAQRLAGRALGNTPLIDDLRELCDRIGGRPTGSKACDRAGAWGAARFRAAGVKSVTTETYTIPNLWLPGYAEASCVAPEQFAIRLAAAPFSPDTSGHTALEAPLLDAGDGSPDAFEHLGTRARGAIVLVRSREMKTLDDLFAEYMRNAPLVESARKAGVAALLLESTRPRGLLYRHPVTFNGALAAVPAAIVAREHAERLGRLLERGELRMRLLLTNQTAGAYQTSNVIAEIRGREKPQEIVLLGAHLDSWDLGTGAQDNGVNAALVIDVARGFSQLGLIPRRTVRFVLFTGEEQGMWGSAEYVRRHASELDYHAAAVVFDVGSGRTMGFFLNGREDLRQPVESVLGAVAGLGASNHALDALDGTDNFDFLLSGVPNLVANQDPAPYLPDYHAESDVFDMVDAREARNNAAIAAALVWGLANNPAPPPRRLTHAEIEKVLRDTRLDVQMKAFGQWEDWVAGRRGIAAAQ